ncbi:MAG: hypothetical protein Q7O66_22125, partial [Dehalococcoidia bacterium]|nr:hypothetical protein [Dehalococcoidia bacterium]
MDHRYVDRLIRELIETGRDATLFEVGQILAKMASAPFDSSIIHVPKADRGIVYGGLLLGARSDAWTYHLVKRVVVERQWAVGTSAEQYLADLRAAVRHDEARLVVFKRRGGNMAATVTPTEQFML